jgi:hypothetical protein
MNTDLNNKWSQPVPPGLAQYPTINSGSIADPRGQASPDPMQAEQARNVGMATVLDTTTSEQRAAISNAILSGLDATEGRRAEDALALVGFIWPAAVKPRSLGAIVSRLARTGQIIECGWTKGRLGRSHAGRVSLWLRAKP